MGKAIKRGKASDTAPRHGMSLFQFAARVHASFATMPAKGVFGGDKVWTHAAWAWSGAGKEGMTLPEFKGLLWESHRAGYLELCRADMIEAMDPYDVKRSEIRTEMGATFNLIRAREAT